MRQNLAPSTRPGSLHLARPSIEASNESIAAPDRSQAVETRGRLPGVAPSLWAAVVLLAGLSLTGLIARNEWQDLNADADASLELRANSSVRQLVDPLNDAAASLRALQTVFLANDRMDQDSFTRYVESLRAPVALPGHVATAFARRQADPNNRGAVSYPYALAAPLEGNESLIGFDIASQAANLVALEHSRDADTVAVSQPFLLHQRDAAGNRAMGLVLRLPIFSRGQAPLTVEERRTRELGSLAISAQLDPLLADSLRGPVLDSFRVRIRDLDPLSGGPWFFDSGSDVTVVTDHPGYTRVLEFGGRRWELQLQPRPAPLDLARLATLIIAGITISALLSLLLWSLTTTRRRALLLGQRMSARFGESEARLRILNDLLPALVLLSDYSSGRIVYANQAARLRLGDVTGRTLAELLVDPALQKRARTPARLGEQWNSEEAALVGVNGVAFWVSASMAQVEVDGATHHLIVANDVSEQRELTAQLSYQATHDALTELCNRREFERRVEQTLVARKALHDPAGCALLYIDLDQFKLINDISGHMAGDQLLAQLALKMRQQIRPGDVLARLGGDEFGLLAFHADHEGASVLAERLRRCIESLMFTWQEHTYAISASIGVVLIDHAEPTLKDLLAKADTACYQAKENGRNRVHVYREDDETTRRHGEMEWATRLRTAMDEDRLLLDYQEIQPLRADADCGPCVELLLRLRDEQGGLVMPGAFLPAAERYGMMPAIDRWVIRSALSHLAQLHPSGSRLATCAINLSGASIEDDGLADFVLACIDEFNVPTHKLCFEITETVAVRNLVKVVQVIERLRQVGCRIALDDFGAGMSSFGYLKNLPVDMIKIDGSFVRDLGTDPMSQTIIRAIAQIGHQRGVKVVAEWVSSQDMVAPLSALGVDFGQGFALHRPERVLFQRRADPSVHAVA